MGEPNLHELVQLFLPDADALGRFESAHADKISEPYRSLLDHEHHMTVTLEAHYGCKVGLHVLSVHESDEVYAREIVLTRELDQVVVQYGIVRVRLHCIPQPVCKEIRAGRQPLGRLLIQNDVLRKVRLAELWAVTPSQHLGHAFGFAGEPPKSFGRTALIHVDGEPAVELLEILAPVG